MKAFGVVAEFNPFHGGHKYVIEQGRILTGCDVCVCVMSGNFVQRGGPAVFSKWERAEEAVRGGADLVIELPVIYASSSAEIFAEGAVRTLFGTGGLSHLVFGSESGDTERLVKAAEILRISSDKIDDILKEGLSEGKPYHAAAAEARERAGIDAELTSEPNDILALEYLKVLLKLNEENPGAGIRPVAVKRTGAGHHETASDIRRELKKTEGGRLKAMEENYWNLVRSRILLGAQEDLEKIASAGEGLGNKLKKEIRYAESMEDFVDRVKSKRYPYTRIGRLLTQTLLGIERGAAADFVTYVRPLAMNGTGGKFLKYIRKNELAGIPIIDKVGRDSYFDEAAAEVIKKDVQASDIYNVIAGKNLYDESDFVKKTTIIKGAGALDL